MVTTASAHNHDYVRSLGAEYVFDHGEANVIDQILGILKPGDVVFDVMGTEGPQKAAAEVLSRLGGGKLPTVRMPIATGFDNVDNVLGQCIPSRLCKLAD